MSITLENIEFVTRLAFLPLTTCHKFVQNHCFAGEKTLLLAAKLFWVHTQNANPRFKQGIFDRVAFPSDFHSKPFCNKLFEKSKAAPRNSARTVLWQPGFCPGRQWQKMKPFFFHSDTGQIYNISFSCHPLIFEWNLPEHRGVGTEKKFLAYFINKWNKPRVTYMCLYVYKLTHTCIPMYMYAFCDRPNVRLRC